MRLDHGRGLGVVAALAFCLVTACGGGAAAPSPTSAPASPSGAPAAPSPPRPGLASPAASPSASVSSSSAGATPSPSTEVVAGESYEVQPGDTLATIAQQFYGDPTQWRRIYDANKDTIGADPDKLKLGSKLTIPPKQS